MDSSSDSETRLILADSNTVLPHDVLTRGTDWNGGCEDRDFDIDQALELQAHSVPTVLPIHFVSPRDKFVQRNSRPLHSSITSLLDGLDFLLESFQRRNLVPELDGCRSAV